VVNTVLLKHDIVAGVGETLIILKHGITSSLSIPHILKHYIIDPFLLTVNKTINLRDTSKRINLKSDSGNTTSEGSN